MSLNRNSKKAKATPPAKRESQPAKTYLASTKVPARVVRYGIADFLNNTDTHSLSCSGFNLYSALNEELDKRFLKQLLTQLLQAIIDHDIPSVTRILQYKPELLLIEPADLGIKQIESQKTWQRFLPEKALIMAQKLARKLQHPATMIKALLPHFDTIEQIKIAGEVKANEKKAVMPEVVKQWILPAIPEDKEDQELQEAQQAELDKALQRKYINDHFIKLIETLSSDNTIEVKWEMNKESKLYEAKILNASQATELALDTFRKMLLPDNAVAIDDYVDIAQFLIAAYHAYDDHFSDEYNPKIYFRNSHQRDAYAVWVIGFIIPLLGGPEVGKKWCKGFYYDVNNRQPFQPNPHADALQLRDGRSFYRVSRLSLVGPGFTFLCSIYGASGAGRWPRGPRVAPVFGKLCQANAAEFGELTRRVYRREEQVAPTQQSRYVIS